MTGPMTSEFSEDVYVPLVLPEPEVPQRTLEDAETPGGALAIVRFARKQGFDAIATYSLGPVKHSTQDSFTIKHCVVVRIKDPSTGTAVAGASYYAPKRENGETKYSLETCLVRAYADVYQGIFSLKELKAWLQFQPEHRPFEEIVKILDERTP